MRRLDSRRIFDSLDITNVENCANRKRLRVATRQIHVFSEAARSGFAEGAVAVSHGLDFLFSFARHPEGAFASHFNLASKQMSADRDTYDLAFVLFALMLKLSPMASRDAALGAPLSNGGSNGRYTLRSVECICSHSGGRFFNPCGLHYQ